MVLQAFAVPVENQQALYLASINCGKDNGGLANISPPDYTDLHKAASRLSNKGGTCTTPAGAGKCIRIACDDTTGIWVRFASPTYTPRINQ